MIAWISFRSTERSTPLTISVPSSSATRRFLISSNAIRESESGLVMRVSGRVRDPSLASACQLPSYGGPCRGDGRSADQPAAQAQRRPQRRLTRLIVEPAVRARISGQRLVEVVGGADRLRPTRVLAFPAHAPEHPVAGAWRELLAPQELLRAPADRKLADRVLATMQDRLRVRLRLVDRRHRLRLVADALARAVELGCVDRAGQDERDVDGD